LILFLRKSSGGVGLRRQPNEPTMTKQIVPITIAGVEKLVEISRLTESHSWVCRTPVILRFPTGGKTHEATITVASNKTGQWTLQAQGFRNANRAFMVAWGDQMAATSKW